MHRNPRRAAVKRADASAICAAAAALASRGQAGEAIAGYRLALVIEPRCARAHSDLAQLLSGQGRLEEAICHMHKGNIMKFTEGRSRTGATRSRRPSSVIRSSTKECTPRRVESRRPEGADQRPHCRQHVPADSARPDEYSVIATPNLNGDYISDAAAALTGGLGLAPAQHRRPGSDVRGDARTAPKYAARQGRPELVHPLQQDHAAVGSAGTSRPIASSTRSAPRSPTSR